MQIKQHPGVLDDPSEAAKIAVELVKDGGCACVLVNTVKHAQAVFKKLKELDPGGERYLFHARFPAWRRSEIEDQVVGLFGKKAALEGRRPKRAVLVATQVVEQSLDLDFDVMISQLAPIDLLLQRCGRLWRHKEIGIPRYGLEEALHVLMPEMENPDFGGSGYVYGEAVLLRTVAILESRDCFRLPDDFRPVIDACYGDECVMSRTVSEREQMLADEKNELKRELDAGKASKCLIPPPSTREFSLASPSASLLRDESDEATTSYFSASTRLGDSTRSVMLLEDPGLTKTASQEKAPARNLMKELFREKVDIAAYWLENACPAEGFDPIFEGEKWLRRTIVIPMRQGMWQGTRNGKPFRITRDLVMGVEVHYESEVEECL